MAGERAVSASAEKRQRLKAELAAARRQTLDHVQEAQVRVRQTIKGMVRLRWTVPIFLAAGAGLIGAAVLDRRRRPTATVRGAQRGALDALRSTLWSVLMRSAARYLEARLLALPETMRRRAAADSLRADERP